MRLGRRRSGGRGESREWVEGGRQGEFAGESDEGGKKEEEGRRVSSRGRKEELTSSALSLLLVWIRSYWTRGICRYTFTAAMEESTLLL